MASSILTTTYLDFQNGATQAKMSNTSASVLTLEGVALGTCLLTGLSNPVSGPDAATKEYVDSVAVGLFWKTPARVASTGPLNIATDLENGDTIDGVIISTGDRILLKDQATATENGIYVAVAAGAASRSADLANGFDADGIALLVTEGTTYADKGFTQTESPGIVGTDNLTFVIFSAATSGAAGPVSSIQYNSAGSFAGSSTLLFNGTDTVLVGTEGATFNFQANSSATPAIDGASLTFATGAGGTTGDGGDILLTAGVGGSTSGAGGDILLTAGTVTSGNGGVMVFTCGETSTNVAFTFRNETPSTLVEIIGTTQNPTAVGEGTLRVQGGASFTQSVYAIDFNATSDIRLKTNITSISDPLEKLRKINGYEYDWKDIQGKRQLGVIAQQLEEVGLGQVVTGDDRKAVNYNALIPLLVEAVKQIANDLHL